MSTFHSPRDVPTSHQPRACSPGTQLAVPPLLGFLQSADPAQTPAVVHLAARAGADLFDDGPGEPSPTITLCGQRFAVGEARRPGTAVDVAPPPCPLCLHVATQA